MNKPDIKNSLKNRILVLDGAMGSLIQTYKLEEDDFRGTRFKNHSHPLKGNNDLLALVRPDVLKEIQFELQKEVLNLKKEINMLKPKSRTSKTVIAKKNSKN